MLMYKPYIRKQLWHLRGQCVQHNPRNFEVHSSSFAGISPILSHEQTWWGFYFFHSIKSISLFKDLLVMFYSQDYFCPSPPQPLITEWCIGLFLPGLSFVCLLTPKTFFCIKIFTLFFSNYLYCRQKKTNFLLPLPFK